MKKPIPDSGRPCCAKGAAVGGTPAGGDQISPVKGYKEIPNLLTALADHGMKAMKKGLTSKAKTA